MAFAQLTYRESLRDIETCLSAQASKLYAMGFRDPVRRSTLADANEGRDWRIYAELAQRLIAQARKLYLGEDLGFDLANAVYALEFDDHRSLPGGVSVGALAHDQSSGEDAHAAGSAGKYRELYPYMGRQAPRRSRTGSVAPEAGAIYVMDRGYVDFGRLYGLHQAGAFFVTRAKSNMECPPRILGSS